MVFLWFSHGHTRCCPGLRRAAASRPRRGVDVGVEPAGGAEVRVHPGGSQSPRWQLGWFVYGLYEVSMNGFYMVCIWFIYVSIWLVYGFYMVCIYVYIYIYHVYHVLCVSCILCIMYCWLVGTGTWTLIFPETVGNGTIIPVDIQIFQRGWNHQPDMVYLCQYMVSIWFLCMVYTNIYIYIYG